MSNAPYYDVGTEVPSWGRLISGTDGRIAFELDAQGLSNGPDGTPLVSAITPQSCVPHGETVAILSSAMVQSTLVSSANGYEGLSHSLQGFVRGPTGEAVKVYDNNVLQSGDPSKWVNEQFSDYRRVTFIDQIPANVVPEFLQSTWFIRGSSGQVRLANLELRDHYSSTYASTTAGDEWTDFEHQLNDNMIAGRGAYSYNRYLETLIVDIAKGQPVSMDISAYIENARLLTPANTRLPFNLGVSLKMLRKDGLGADWFNAAIGNDSTSEGITDQIASRSERIVAENAYSQVDVVMWIMALKNPSTSTNNILVKHDGVTVNIQVDDSVKSGS